MILILEYSGRDNSTIVIEDLQSCIILLQEHLRNDHVWHNYGPCESRSCLKDNQN